LPPAPDGDFALVRYDADGDLDSTFGSGGKVLTDFGRDETASAGLALQPDGKIVAAGSSGYHAFALARYDADGSLDSSFGSDGKVLTDFGSESFPRAFAVALQPDRRIVVAGDVCSECGPSIWLLARYNADGSLDSSFSGDGIVRGDPGGYRQAAYALAVQPDGRIVAAGSSDYPSCCEEHFALARYNVDGSQDMSFGSSGHGWALTDFGRDDEACAVALQPDGKIVAAGSSGSNAPRCPFGGRTQFALVRYKANGRSTRASESAARSWAPPARRPRWHCSRTRRSSPRGTATTATSRSPATTVARSS
jgi:uncharacterized delta-60 repeat protein